MDVGSSHNHLEIGEEICLGIKRVRNLNLMLMLMLREGEFIFVVKWCTSMKFGTVEEVLGVGFLYDFNTWLEMGKEIWIGKEREVEETSSDERKIPNLKPVNALRKKVISNSRISYGILSSLTSCKSYIVPHKSYIRTTTSIVQPTKQVTLSPSYPPQPS